MLDGRQPVVAAACWNMRGQALGHQPHADWCNWQTMRKGTARWCLGASAVRVGAHLGNSQPGQTCANKGNCIEVEHLIQCGLHRPVRKQGPQ